MAGQNAGFLTACHSPLRQLPGLRDRTSIRMGFKEWAIVGLLLAFWIVVLPSIVAQIKAAAQKKKAGGLSLAKRVEQLEASIAELQQQVDSLQMSDKPQSLSSHEEPLKTN